MIEMPEPKPRRWVQMMLGFAAITALSAATGWGAAQLIAPVSAAPDLAKVRAALKLRLPKTPIDAITCQGLGGLCEIVSKATLFYVDARAKYLVIGRIYDMEARQDLTAARLLALNPDLLAAGAAKRQGSEVGDAGSTPSNQPGKVQRVSLAGLPANGAITWGPVQGPRLVVFSDFHCAYCKRLSAALAAIGARVEERPISIFGADSRKQAERVLCSPRPEVALQLAYSGSPLPVPKSCDVRGLDANEAFAKARGFSGTPVIVRSSDGAVIEGYRDAAQLRTFLASPPIQG